LNCSFNYKTRQLVALAQDDNKTALDLLCKVYGERIRWMVRLRMGREIRSKLESMDLVQDVLIHALQGLEDFTYKNEGDFVRWLSKIVENTFRDNLDRLYAAKRDIRKEVRLRSNRPTTTNMSVGFAGPIDATTPSVIMSQKEDLVKLEKAMDSLKPEYREVIVLTKIEGFSYNVIAGRLDKSSDAVRKLVSRAMTALVSAFESVV
jgi:RNA polymerase sigma-70 factor (ECF subfamily)